MESETRNRFPLSWSLAVLAALCLVRGMVGAEEPVLKFRFGFDDAAGATTASDTSNGGSGLVLQLVNRAGAPAKNQAAPESGPAHRGGALRLCRATTGDREPMVATLTNAALGFGEVRAFTATLWFKQKSAVWFPLRVPATPRLFLLWDAGETPLSALANSVEIGLLAGHGMQFKVSGVGAQAIFPFDLPTNQWLFAAMVCDGTNVMGYLGAESMRATLVAGTAAPRQTVTFGTNTALYLGKAPRRFNSFDTWPAVVPKEARDALTRALYLVAFDGWLADVRFYAGAGDARFVERIRQLAAGSRTAPRDLPAPSSKPPEVVAPLDSTQGVWLVATAPAFRAPLAPLIEERRAQGFRVMVVETTNVLSAEEIWLSQGEPLETCIRRLLGPAKGSNYVLLAGIAGTPDPVAARQIAVPALHGRNGEMKQWPSDYSYGLPRRGADGECALAVGRFPARTMQEMEGMVRKTLSMEKDCRHPGAWRSRLALIEGNPQAGPPGEMFVNWLTTQRLGKLHPAWSLRAVLDMADSAYYCPKGGLHDATMDCLQAGALFSIYMGHSCGGGLCSYGLIFLSRDDWTKIGPGPGQGVFFSCGCFGCELGDGDGYCLAAMRNPAGPAAVIGACAGSYSTAGLLASDGLLGCLAQTPFPSRLADYWLAVQGGLARGPIDPMTFGLLDQADGTAGKVPLATQRLEALEMWMLLGDPALRLPVVPLDISLDPTGPVRAGQSLVVNGVVPARLAGASVRVTLERSLPSRSANVEPLPPDSREDRANRDRIAAENYRRANQFVLASTTAAADAQHFHCVLAVPALPWPEVVLRAVAENGDELAQGVTVLPVSGDSSPPQGP